MAAMSKALVHARISLLQVWLRVLIFSSVCPRTWCAEYQSPPEVVIPLKVTVSSRDMSLAGWMSYSLHFGGQRHIISMKSKSFLVSRQLSMFTYSDQGDLLEDRPFVQSDCYYNGFVEGNQESMVAITTCFGGFQGTIQINDTAYEIKPKSPSSTFEHLIYKIDREETQLLPMRCGLTDEEIAGQVRLQENDNPTLMQEEYETWRWTHTQYIELALVVDHEHFLYRRSNTTLVMKDVFIIMNRLNLFLFLVDINVALRILTIWTKENPIPVKDIHTVLPTFCEWKRTNLNSHTPHDIAHLFVKYNFSKYFGIAYVGTICNMTFNCGVDSISGEDFFNFGHIVAHEIGHNLGMPHDGIQCTCGGGPCLMSATSNSKKFSNCSYAVLWANRAKTSCIYSKPSPSDVFSLKFCGNGVVDEGEQCDCGSAEACDYSLCCQPDCTLKPGANCDTGLCCSNLCKILPPGTICRIQENECDLPEWCNGSSHECPEDMVLQDGSSCRGGGYCYEKRCNSHDTQCKKVFGRNASKASDSCFQELNTRGYRFGNCGIMNNAYVKCDSPDIFCGRIQCKEVTRIPYWRSHYTAHWTHLNGVTCWSTDYHIGMSIPDLGDIKDGTKCGPEHVCINRRCVNKKIWASDCSPMTCNMKGVCNNKHHCHCNYGWAPPYCQVNGTGGSIDSGPNLESEDKEDEEDINEEEKENKWEKENRKQKNDLPSWLFPLFFVVLVLLLFCFLFETPEPEGKEETESSTEKETSTSTSTTSSITE